MRPSFNVTIIQPPGYPHAQAVGELWIYLADVLLRSGYSARATINTLTRHETNVVLCAHLLNEQQARNLPPGTIVFNSEKLEQTDGWYLANGAYGAMIRDHTVWDYSARNIACVPHANTAQIPLYFSPTLKKQHPRHTAGPLLFYGSMTERRKTILAGLRQAGVPVALLPFGCYGDDRDKAMYQAGAVLNLHTDDAHKVFEPVRCFHPLINGIPVITEDFHDEPLFDVYRRATFVTGPDPIADIARLLSDRPAFLSQAARQCETFATTDPLPTVRDAVARYLASRPQSAHAVA